MADGTDGPDTTGRETGGPARRPRRMRVAALAAALVVLAVGIGLYVIGQPGGNNGGEEIAAAPGVDCSGSVDKAKALGAAATGEVAAMLAADPPQDLSGLAFTGPDGKPMTVADLKGRTVLMNLWATWCVPCREEMPALDGLQAALGGDDFQVVAVNVDSGGDEKPKKFLGEIGIENLAYYREHSLELFNDAKKRGLALGLPVTMLIDPKGCLLTHMNGPAAWDSGDAKAWVQKALDTGA